MVAENIRNSQITVNVVLLILVEEQKQNVEARFNSNVLVIFTDKKTDLMVVENIQFGIYCNQQSANVKRCSFRSSVCFHIIQGSRMFTTYRSIKVTAVRAVKLLLVQSKHISLRFY